MTRRQLFVRSVFVLAALFLPVALSPGGGLCGWQFTKVCRKGFNGVFLYKGNKCLSLYRDRQGQALTWWADLAKQELPSAIAFPYNGKYYFQKSVWKSAG